MKNSILLILASLLLCSALAGQGQYEKGMSKAFDLWRTDNNPTGAIAMFERIAQAEKDNWLPSYHAANILIISSFGTTDKTQVNEMLEKAKVNIAEAHKRSPDNAEIYTLEGLLYTGYVAMDPATFGMTYSGKIMGLHQKAIELDETNPRAQLNAIEYEIGGAKFFKTDLKVFCERLEATIPLFEAQKQETPFHPFYGALRIPTVKEDCGCE